MQVDYSYACERTNCLQFIGPTLRVLNFSGYLFVNGFKSIDQNLDQLIFYFGEDCWLEAVDIFCVNFQCDVANVGNDPGGECSYGNLVALSEYGSGL
jgi:hypothetical protein